MDPNLLAFWGQWSRLLILAFSSCIYYKGQYLEPTINQLLSERIDWLKMI